MERGAVGSEEEDDGGKAASCRIQARASTPGHREESTGRGGEGQKFSTYEDKTLMPQ